MARWMKQRKWQGYEIYWLTDAHKERNEVCTKRQSTEDRAAHEAALKQYSETRDAKTPLKGSGFCNVSTFATTTRNKTTNTRRTREKKAMG